MPSPQTDLPSASARENEHPQNEQHRSAFPRKALWVLVSIVALAFGLRAVLIKAGMPLLLYEDEPIYYKHALNFGFGYWHLNYFKKPSFFLYFYGAFYYLGFLYSKFMSWKDYVEAFWQNPTYVATIGRSLSVIFATGTVYQLARLGTRYFGWIVGLTAAFWLAVDNTHLRISPIVISDIPSLFFVVTTAWFALKIYEKGLLKDYLLCALAIVLSASFKYNIFTLAFLISAHVLGTQKRLTESVQTDTNLSEQKPPILQPSQAPEQLSHLSSKCFWKAVLLDKRLWLALGLIPVVFLMLNPMILINFSSFWSDIDMERRHMLLRDPRATESFKLLAAFQPIFFKILPRNLGWPIYLLGLAGIPWMLWRYRPKALVLMSFPLLFLAVILQFKLINAKYLLPIMVFWYIAAAVMLRDSLTSALKWINQRFRKADTTPSQSNKDPEQREAGQTLHPKGATPIQATDFFSPAFLTIYATLALAAASLNIDESLHDVALSTQLDTRQVAYQSILADVQEGDLFFLEPDTLTLNNRVIRSHLVIIEFTHGEFSIIHHLATPTAYPTMALINPRYVLIDFGDALKNKSSHGETYYTMPHQGVYYSLLKQHYRLKQVFSPYPITLTTPEMRHIIEKDGFGSLYGKIQEAKTKRQRPGPLMLLMERRTPN